MSWRAGVPPATADRRGRRKSPRWSHAQTARRDASPGQAGRLPSVLALAALAVFLLATWIVFGPLPAIDSSRFTGSTIVDRNGVVLYEPLSADGVRSEWLDRVPARVAQATVAAEDARFYRHPGVDPIAVARAAWHDLRHGAFVEGGSTLTQQVAKMLTGGRERGFAAKIGEAVVAFRLERRYSKQQILALYVNLAPYGNQIHGIARASQRYFGCAPEELTVAQAAFLASLPQRPSAFNPLRDARRASWRQAYVLARMRRLGFITDPELKVARGERLRFDRGAPAPLAQHFVERVMQQGAPGRVVTTTLDAALQRTVQGIVTARREDLLRHGAHSAAVAVLDNATGDWLAWEGSGDYFGEEFGGAIDGVSALRQPGSTLKPFTYALAFERGDSPATVLADVPSSFPTAEQGVVYTPRNYDGRYRGPLRARSALAGSENVPAVALLAKAGAPSLLRLLRNSGFTDLDRTSDYYGLGITLGDAEVRLEQLVAAYAVFARGGTAVRPRFLLEGDASRSGPAARERRLLSARTAFWITDILSDPEARAFIFGMGGSLDFPFPVAVKTGTSQAYRDNWTIGYTRDVTVGVWVGNFNRRELRSSSGVTGAGPIFHDVMMAAARPNSGAIAEPPANVERVEVCALSGRRPSTACLETEAEWLPSEAPVEFCSWHRAGGLVDWPDEYRAWARANDLRVAPREVKTARAASPLRVVNPPDGATYLIDPTLRMSFQTLSLRAVAPTSVGWLVDDREIGTAPRDSALSWKLRPGNHTITARDERGNRETVRIYVR